MSNRRAQPVERVANADVLRQGLKADREVKSASARINLGLASYRAALTKSARLLYQKKNQEAVDVLPRQLGYAGKDATYAALSDEIANLEKQLKSKEETTPLWQT